jgi:aldose 1-epimerase
MHLANRKTFGRLPDGTVIDLITVRNGGVELSVINYGCIIVSLSVPDAHGQAQNVVLGHDRFDRYLDSSPYFGALVGRYANRIANGRFSIDGRACDLSRNDPPNHLHGGFKGFDKHAWEAEIEGGDAIRFRRRSIDGEEGFPGTLDVEVTYSIGDRHDLWMKYEATTDAPTHVNMTQHSYFNLRGAGDILAHRLTIDADAYLPVDERMVPTGEVAPVAGTPFDFREASGIGARIGAVHEQLTRCGGYDHNYILNRGAVDPVLAARVFDPSSGRVLEVRTTEPGLQFYSGQAAGHRGFCLEAQHFPDSPNRPEFPSTLLRPGERYRSLTGYTFST